MSSSFADSISPRRSIRRRRDTPRTRKALFDLSAERLEPRQVPAIVALPALLVPVHEVEPNNTLDCAQSIGVVSEIAPAAVSGAVGNWNHAANDVDWYSFDLTAPSRVHLTLGPPGGSATFQGVLSLYNNDPFDFSDPYDLIGHRLVTQVSASATGGLATLDRALAPGTYYVAVSGAGNLDFHPLMAGSGLDGSTGDYNLLVTADAVARDAVGPVVLASDPAPGSVLDSSPLVLRFDLSASIDPSSINPGMNVRLVYNPSGAFGNGNDADVALGSVNFSDAAHELQLFPLRALEPGFYQVVLAGDGGKGSFVLTASDGSGVPLGSDAGQPAGRDYVMTFQISGIEGGKVADDTAATAHALGDVTAAGLVRVTGALGNDPYYDPYSSDPAASAAGNDVDMYRFRVTGPGRYAFVAEAFAGRIGSPLDPGLSLYRVDPTDGSLHFVDGNNNTLDPALSTGGAAVLLTDPALFVSLTEGEYVVAVSAGFNTPSPREQQPLDTPGLFDPNVSHSGQNGWSTGPYVLDLLVKRCDSAPWVMETTPRAAETLDAPPTELTVQFSAPVNLQNLAFAAFLQNGQDSVQAVYIVAADGTRTFPRLSSYDRATNRATFLMLDGLSDGSYELHLSGALGLTDLGGNPLLGSTPDGDYVVPFTVDGPARGVDGNPLRLAARPLAPGESYQNLGVLFPHELQAGIDLQRDATVMGGQASEDAYKFQVLQIHTYAFSVTPDPMPPGMSLWLTDVSGQPVNFAAVGDGSTILTDLHPGFYVLHVGGWSLDLSADMSYQVHLNLAVTFDNPPPLVFGPAPALQIHLDNVPMPTPFGPPLNSAVTTVPSTSGGVMGPFSSLVGSSDGASGLYKAGAGVNVATTSGRSIASGELITLGVGPVGDANGPSGPSLASVSVQLALGGVPLKAGQGLSSLLTFLHGFDLGDGNGVSETDGVVESPRSVFEGALASVAAPAPTPELAAIKVEVPSEAEVTALTDDVPVATALLAEEVDAGRSGRRLETGDAQRADLGWLAGLTIFGATALTCLHRNRPGRWMHAARSVPPGDARHPGAPIGLARAPRERLWRRRGSRISSDQAT
jgi:Bacterial pre-peptidase C-terminal domain